MRYAAMSVAGGGLMVDYDVINYGFPTVAADPHVMRFYSDQSQGQTESTGVCLAPMSLYEGLCQLFMEWEPDQRDWNPNAKPPMHHCSDLTFLNQMVDGRRPKPAWIQIKPGCAVYPEPTCKTSALVHYCYSFFRDHGPKHTAIPQYRPI
jgi:hypothetical protein